MEENFTGIKFFYRVLKNNRKNNTNEITFIRNVNKPLLTKDEEIIQRWQEYNTIQLLEKKIDGNEAIEDDNIKK